MVLFHDINVCERNFGVWKLWDELSSDPSCFSTAVLNGHGLGILCRGQALANDRETLSALLPVLVSKGVLLDQLAKATPGGSFESLQTASESQQGQTKQPMAEPG